MDGWRNTMPHCWRVLLLIVGEKSQSDLRGLVFTSGAVATAMSMGGKCLLLCLICEIKAVTAQIDIETYVIEVTDFNSEVRFDL